MAGQEKPRTVVEIVYAGRRLTRHGKLVHYWFRDGSFSSWKAKELNRVCVIGGVYAIETVDTDEERGSVIYPGTLFYRNRLIDDPERIQDWALVDEETRVEHQAALLERKALKEHDPIAGMTVQELRQWLNSGGSLYRTARIAIVLKELGIR